MGKSLIFMRRRHGGDYAQRDNVKYEIQYSAWYGGKSTSGALPYHIARRDMKNKDYISTENTRRFATQEEAEQLCQDIYEGKIDIEVLRAEEQKYNVEKEQRNNEAARSGADNFRKILLDKGIALSDFLDATKAWDDMHESSRMLLYKESEGV